jgi:hypothetical protein
LEAIFLNPMEVPERNKEILKMWTVKSRPADPDPHQMTRWTRITELKSVQKEDIKHETIFWDILLF